MGLKCSRQGQAEGQPDRGSTPSPRQEGEPTSGLRSSGQQSPEKDLGPFPVPRPSHMQSPMRKNAQTQTDEGNHADNQAILQQLAQFQTAADRVEMQRALSEIAAKADAPIIFSEEEDETTSGLDGLQTCKVENGGGSARPKVAATPVGKPFAKRVTSDVIRAVTDPIGRLKEEGFTAAQARAIIGATGLQIPDIEGTNLHSSYFRTLSDTKLYDVPWPNDYVYRNNGKKASFDTLSVPKYVQGYCNVILANLPVINENVIAIDHIYYLSEMMSDTEGGDWEIVHNSHMQVLHMAE